MATINDVVKTRAAAAVAFDRYLAAVKDRQPLAVLKAELEAARAKALTVEEDFTGCHCQ